MLLNSVRLARASMGTLLPEPLISGLINYEMLQMKTEPS